MKTETSLYAAAGLLLIMFGILLSSSTLVESLRTTPVAQDLLERLLTGATLFRIGIVILGILIMVSGRLFRRRSGSRNETSKSDPNRHLILTILAAVLCTALALRLYRLGNGLWIDEIMQRSRYFSNRLS